MSTDLERRLHDAFHEDARHARLVNPDRPADGRQPQPASAVRRPGSRPWLVAAAAATVLIVAGTALVLRTARDSAPEDDPVDRPTIPAPPDIPVPLWVDLPAGSTVALPRMPISGPGGGAGTWTGTELIVWGEPAASDGTPHPVGVAFNLRTGTWRTIAPSPLSNGTPVAWTGNEMIVWGSSTDGAAYDPEADTWRTLPDAPFSSSDAAAVWTGNEVVVLGGFDYPVNAAAYDPATDEWRSLVDPEGYLVAGPVWTGTSVLAVLDVIGPPLAGPNYHRRDNSSGLRLARYDLSTDTWHIDADANYASLVGIPDADGLTRSVLAVPVRPGEPVDLLDATGTPIGSLPAHPVDIGGSATAASGLWLGEEAVFSIDALDDWLFPSPETWALDPEDGTWRALRGDVPSIGEGTAVGDVLLATDGDRGTAYRIRIAAGD
jgi:hypothetical protein